MTFRVKGCSFIRLGRAIAALSLGIVILLFSLPSFSQTNLGRIFGTVTDQSGGVIVGAKVTVIDTARGINRALATDGAGQYNAPNLIPGTYTIRVEAPGFQAFERQNVPVEVGQELHVDATLQPGAQTQTVTVTESVPLVTTTSAVVTSTIENKDINQLPLNGRNFQSMTDFRPGVQTKPGGGTDARFSNGQQSEENIWLLDGLFNKGTYGGNSVIGGGNLAGEGATLVPLDTIQEVTFIENPKAEYGWGTGVIVNLGFKSGTNNLHGSAYAYGRDDPFDARNPFATRKPGTDLEQFGMSLGGPIKKNKIFFFGGYEGKRVTSSTTQLINEPTTANLAGNTAGSFPAAIAALEGQGFCNPAAAGCSGPGETPLSQLSLNLAGCTLPAGVLTGAATCNAANGVFNNGTTATSNIPIQIPNFQHTDNMLEKIDYHISDRNSLNGEYFFGTGNTYSTVGSPVQPYWGATTPVRGQGFTVVDVWTPNSTWVNEARGGYHRYNQVIGIGECSNFGAPPATGKSDYVGYTDGSPNYPSVFGLATGTPDTCAMPFTTVGTTFTALGNEARGYEPRLENAYKFEDAVSYTRGPHVFKFGVEYRDSRLAGGAEGYAQGAINFGTGGINAPSITTGANALEDFLVGYPSSGQLLVGNASTNTVQSFIAAFAQDDWRATRNLTLNLGLRWEYTTPLGEANNNFGDFYPGVTPSGLIQIGNSGVNSLWHGDYKVFMPRVGLAWDIFGSGKTVFRAGAGTMSAYNATSGMLGNQSIDPNTTPTGVPYYAPNGTVVATPPGGTITTSQVILTNSNLNAASAAHVWAANQPVFNGGALACGEGNGAPGVVTPAGVTTEPSECIVGGFNPNLTMPTIYYWNADIQQSFGNNISVDIAYVGNHSSGLLQLTNINQPLPGLGNGTGAAAFNEQLREPYYGTYPWFGQIHWDSNRDDANYDSLQATLRKRVTHGLDFTATYVYSHALDVEDSEFATTGMESNYNTRLDYGNAGYNPFNRFTLTGTWAVPSHRAPAQLLSGWALNTVVELLSGVPYNAADTKDDISGTGENQDRWTLVGSSKNFNWGTTPQPGGFPCYGIAGSSFSGATTGCTVVTPANLPAQCVSAVSGEPTNPNVPSTMALPFTGAPIMAPTNSGLFNLYKYGCYMNNGSVIVPPAQGTYGNMARDMLFGPGMAEWDMSVTKNWTIKERYTAQFRVECFNVTNTTQFANPGSGQAPTSNLSSPSTFGKSTGTINAGGIAISAGAPRQIQLGLRLTF